MEILRKKRNEGDQAVKSKHNKTKQGIVAPMRGRVIPLDKVPDSVFSDRILGDGCAIEPVEGTVYSPVSGTVTSVADSLHAYGFLSEDGQEVLVHVGIETVSLKGEGFVSHVKVGDRVRAGDRIADVDKSL